MSLFDHIEANGFRIPSSYDAVMRALDKNPLFLDEPVRSEEVAQILSMTPNALQAMHTRGYGPEYTIPQGSRRRLYTRRSVLAWLYSGDPAAHRKLKRILAELESSDD